MKKGIKVVLAAASALLISAPAFAFHSGGAGQCEGCHTMHNSLEGAPVVGGQGSTVQMAQYQTGPYLLKANDASGSCLNCHETPGAGTYQVSTTGAVISAAGTAPKQYTPGGDFAWLKKSYAFSIHGHSTTEDGDRHGHNVIASDYGYKQDGTLTTAPGGSYPAGKLACSSCHDPHGKYRRLADGSQVTTGLPIFDSGSYQNSLDPISGVSSVGVYRLLAGVGYTPKSLGGANVFQYRAPDAAAPPTYNRSENTAQTHVAYGQGMSEYCANCHGSMLENGFVSGMAGLVHPAGNNAKLTSAIASNYNAYVSSGVMTNTQPTKAYSTLVPIELGTGDYTKLKPLAVNTDDKDQSASTSTNVSCLSCHRAHASGFASMLRYSMSSEFMTIADDSGNATYPSDVNNDVANGKSQVEQQAAYYDRPATAFGPYARNLCNKCHAKD